MQNGSEVVKDRYPYSVSLQPDPFYGHICGGVLVDADVVATAAHCVHQGSVENNRATPRVIIGGHKRKHDSEDPGEV